MCKLLCVQFVLLMCLSNAAIGQWVTPGSVDTCRTPSGSKGNCIDLRECAPLLQLLQKAPISQANIHLLRKSHCGFVGPQPKVCCPAASPVGSMDDLSSHPSYRLLPHRTCGAQLDDRIFGGNQTGLFEYPWMALLAYRRQKTGVVGFHCGGTLITDRYVLTAAHCILTGDYTLLSVRLGEHNIDTKMDCEILDNTRVCADPPQDRGIAATIVHPGYNPKAGLNRFENDIALIRLSSPADLRSDSVRPVCLPVTRELQTKDLTGRAGLVTGWGRSETARKSAVLLQVHLPVVSNDKCAAAHRKQATIVATQLCATGADGKDSCEGDSGGPLKFPGVYNGNVRMVQYGIVSFGSNRCGTGAPGVYTRVTHYVDWILDNLKP